MPNTPTIIRQRRKRIQHARRSFSQRSLRLGLGIGFILSTGLVLAILAGTWYYTGLTSNLPSVQMLPILLNPTDGLLLQPTRLYDRSGQHLLRTIAPTGDDRTFLAYADIPPDLVNATLVLADPGFWDHPGYTLAGWRNPEEHPTLAQKLVFDLLLWNEPASIRRAIRERMLAAQVTAQFGREQVLEWYLNNANYGHQIVGLEAAAQFYYSIPARKLDLGQAAMLAALSQAPALNPLDSPQAAEQRRLETLQILLAFNLAEADLVFQAGVHPPAIKPAPVTSLNITPAFTNLVMTQLAELFSRERIERGGLIILTTLDYDLQLQLDCTLQTQLARLEASGTPPGPDCPAANLLPSLLPGVGAGQTSASALVLDTKTGQVLAAGGQASFSHPAGTLLTPFVYLTGFTRGLSPASLGWDIPLDEQEFDPLYKGPVSLRTALVNDYLSPAFQIETQMGPENVLSITRSFGLQISSSSLLKPTVSVTLPEMAGAYATFANQGILTGQVFSSGKPQPYSVLQLSGVDQSIWGDWSFPERQAVLSPALAYLINHVLSDETARWPSLGQTNPFEIGRPAAVKIGRTLDSSGTWTLGYTPQRLALVWMGNNNPASGLPSFLPAAGLWRALMLTSLGNLPPAGWTAPTGIVQQMVCDPSGMLPTKSCPNVTSEVFLTGSQPLQTDSLYKTYQVNRETNFLATVFTPFDLIEAHVYMEVPPLAQVWATSAGIAQPPTQYDTILQPSPLLDAHISTPPLFADGRGTIEITGSASGPDFSHYRLEYGLGLNPLAWVLIGEDTTSPVEEGLLASWDTGDLNGLVALRLLVVHKDLSVESAVTQLSVDNTAPIISLLSPQEDQEFSLAQTRGVVIQAQVSDPNLVNVKIYVDADLVGDFGEAPYSLVWPPRPGGHTLRVLASDRAGNQAELKILFTVKR
jgi:membrane peptidoglycan carboxypeptidase